MEAAIHVEDLTRVYYTQEGGLRKRRHENYALEGINLSVARGELFGLLGPNGAGKTTLVKILATLLLPTAGRAYVLGFDVARRTIDVRQRIGIVFGGDRGFYNRLSVRDNLTYWAALYRMSRGQVAERVGAVLEKMQLSSIADRPVEALSRGMRQRLHVARGLLPDPAVLLLDEPTIGLDPVAARAMREMIRELQQGGITIFLTTHYMQEAEELCERVAIIDQGKIRYEGTPATLKQRVAQAKTVQLVLVACDEAQLDEITQWPAVQTLQVTMNDGLVHVHVTYRGDASLVGQLVRALDGDTILEIHSREQTLEDAYVSIIGDRRLTLNGE